MANDILFKIVTPLGFSGRVTRACGELIVTVKHPVMHGREMDVKGVLQTPEEVRRSRGDPAVLLFYPVKEPGCCLCAVANRPNEEGFRIATYPAHAIKEGDRVGSR
jgi:hypothetical protein